MEQINKYYFEFSVVFENDYDVNELQKILNINATELVNHKNRSMFFFRTEELNDIYTDDLFETFVKKLSKNLEPLPKIVSENSGRVGFSIVFTQIQDKPCISLSDELIKILAKYNARFDIDYA